ncbi:HNH endonuclease [Saccharopolyspora tripterygii]
MRAWHSAARRDTPSSRHGHGNYAHKQRTLELGVESPGVTWTQWRPILDFYGHRCAYCGSPDDIEIDHVIPVTRGGLHEPGNVIPACRPCNRDKGNQLLHEWRPDLVLDRPAL